jgi:glycosyltransferase involved in cell wall biosynthesis
LLPLLGLANYVAFTLLPPFRAESFRFWMHPWFDRWVLRQLVPGDHAVSSFGYLNECFKFVRRHGGTTFLDAGNSHPENFWSLLAEEHQRWGCPTPPVARHHYERACAMMEDVDYVLSPSSYVSQSFLARGFKPDQILKNVYPVDLACFKPEAAPPDRNRPLTLINTGSLSLRKGTPYLLEAFRIIRRQHPSARLKLIRVIQDDVKPILAKFRDLPIEWSPPLPHPQLAELLRSADVFALPSLEEGLARTAIEAMACGLPVVLTPHCGANDFVQPGINGEVVPLCDAAAIADAVLKCWTRLRQGQHPPTADLHQRLSFESFQQQFTTQLVSLKYLDPLPQSTT